MRLILTTELVENITTTLRNQILINDLSTYPDEFLVDIADYENEPDLVSQKRRYEMYWRVFNASNTIRLFNNIIDNNADNSKNLYTVQFDGSLTQNVLSITVPRHYIKRSFYNQAAAGEHEITPTNVRFIGLIAKLFGHHKDFVMLENDAYSIINKSYVRLILDREQVLESHYVEKYILKLGSTTVSTSNRMDFKKGLNELLTEKHTQELFGKEFLKLTKKELELFEMYLE